MRSIQPLIFLRKSTHTAEVWPRNRGCDTFPCYMSSRIVWKLFLDSFRTHPRRELAGTFEYRGRDGSKFRRIIFRVCLVLLLRFPWKNCFSFALKLNWKNPIPTRTRVLCARLIPLGTNFENAKVEWFFELAALLVEIGVRGEARNFWSNRLLDFPVPFVATSKTNLFLKGRLKKLRSSLILRCETWYLACSGRPITPALLAVRSCFECHFRPDILKFKGSRRAARKVSWPYSFKAASAYNFFFCKQFSATLCPRDLDRVNWVCQSDARET